MKKAIKLNEAHNETGIQRSSEWSKVKYEHLKMQPHCAACKKSDDATAGLQVHHIFPLQYCVAVDRTDLEHDHRNLITLCENDENQHGENHHLFIGHFDDSKSFNIAVEWDANVLFHGISSGVISKHSIWKKKLNTKPKHLEEMNEQEKKELKALMDKTFPQKIK